MCIIPAATPLLLSVWRDPTPNLPNLGVSTKRCVRPLQKSQNNIVVSNVLELLTLMAGEERRWKNPFPKSPERCVVDLP
jgi:hypothetical protein